MSWIVLDEAKLLAKRSKLIAEMVLDGILKIKTNDSDESETSYKRQFSVFDILDKLK